MWLCNKYQVLKLEELINSFLRLHLLSYGISRHVHILDTFGKKNDIFEFNPCNIIKNSKLWLFEQVQINHLG